MLKHFQRRRPGYMIENTVAEMNWEKSRGPKEFTPERDGWILSHKFSDSFIAKVLRRTVKDIENRRQELMAK